MDKKWLLLAVAGWTLSVSDAVAGICEYKPSAYLGTLGLGAAATAPAAVGAGMQAAGFYTLVHATSGLTMLGSTLAGPSAAGTIGIISGTGGVVGTAAAGVMSTTAFVVAGAAVVGLGAFETGCLFAVDRVRDYDQVLALMEEVAEHADPALFRIGIMADGRKAIIISDGTTLSTYPVDELYVADGVLKHSDWFLNTTVANVAWVQVTPADE